MLISIISFEISESKDHFFLVRVISEYKYIIGNEQACSTNMPIKISIAGAKGPKRVTKQLVEAQVHQMQSF